MKFSDYIVFADESGDHGLATIDPEFPVFALVFCVFEKESYCDEIEPAFRRLKFKYFGHDAAILHEREIRKQLPPFAFLRQDAELRARFMEEVTRLMTDAPFHAYCAVKARGREEDRQLELEFRRVASNAKRWGWRAVDFSRAPLEPVFVPKAANLAGHQLSDLIARPLALRVLRPDQPNRAFETIANKIWDLKVFP